VLDVDAPSSLPVIDLLARPLVMQRLRVIARWSTGTDPEADDLVQEALVRVLDPDDVPWVPERGTFFTHMSFVMRQVWDRWMRRARAQREVLDSGLARDETVPSAESSADEALHDRRRVALWSSLAREVLAAIGERHPRVRQVYELAAGGIEDPAEQAEALHCHVEEIYLARKTLARHARAALEAWEQSEQRRMADAREAATKKREQASQ
jgi:DNA-directed RNA polymerase specialized sigma24 family protein